MNATILGLDASVATPADASLNDAGDPVDDGGWADGGVEEDAGIPDSGSPSCSAVVEITSATQSAQTVVEGQTLTLAITACTILPLPIRYRWTDASGTVLGEEASLTHTTTVLQGGRALTLRGTAYVDENNSKTTSFSVQVENVDFGSRLGRYLSRAPTIDRMNMPSDLLIAGDRAFLAIENGALQASPGYVEVVDISDPAIPSFLGITAVTNGPRLAWYGGYLLVLGYDSLRHAPRLDVFEEADLVAGDAVPVAHVDLTSGGGDFLVSEGMAYFECSSSSSRPGICRVDVSDPIHPGQVQQAFLPNDNPFPVSFSVDGNHLFVAGVDYQETSSDTVVGSWDIANFSTPVQLSAPMQIRSGYGFVQIYRQSNRIFVLANGPVAVLDVGVQGAVSLLGVPFLGSGGATMATSRGDQFFTNSDPGVTAWEFSTPSAPQRLGDFSVGDWGVASMVVDNGMLFVAGTNRSAYPAPTSITLGFDLFSLP